MEKFAAVYGLLMVEEVKSLDHDIGMLIFRNFERCSSQEDKNQISEQLIAKDNQMDHMQKKLVYMQDTLAVEEDAKRRMLLRYIHAVKE